jgi:hypothetical protein
MDRPIDRRWSANLVPLTIAARLVYVSVYHRRERAGPSHERLSAIAQAMAALVPLYTASGDSRNPRRVAAQELADQRIKFNSLLVSRTGIDHVIRQLDPAGEELPAAAAEPASCAGLDGG